MDSPEWVELGYTALGSTTFVSVVIEIGSGRWVNTGVSLIYAFEMFVLLYDSSIL